MSWLGLLAAVTLVGCGGRVVGDVAGTDGTGGTAGAGGVHADSPGGASAGGASAGGANAGGANAGGPVIPDCEPAPPPAATWPDGCPCTRRPGAGESSFCPQGAGARAGDILGPEGGVIELWGEQTSGVGFRLEVPAGALASEVSIWLTETTVAPPAGFVDYSPVYHIAPGTLVFDNPPAIVVPFDNIPGEGPMDLAVYFSQDGCEYTRVPDSYVNAGFMNASVRRGGFLFAGYPKTASEANCP